MLMETSPDFLNQQSQSSGPEMPDKYALQKKIAVFGVIALVILIGAYYYTKRLAQQNYDKVTAAALEAQKQTEAIKYRRTQSSPTSTWKTYTNTQYGFEFKYPVSLDVSINNSGAIQIIHPGDKNKTNKPISGIWIYIKDNPTNLNLTDWWNKNGQFKNLEITNIKVGDSDAIYVHSSEGVLENHIILTHGNKIYDLVIMAGISEADQIFSTFRFITSGDFSNLPLDPGEAGKATLAGIDSDHDGVRDDVQRYIASIYPNATKARLALSQVAISFQALLLDSSDKVKSRQHANEKHQAWECLEYVLPGRSDDLVLAMRAQYLNTKLRSYAYIQADQQLSGMGFDAILPNKSSCNFDPNSLPN